MHDPRMHERVVDQITFAIRSGAYRLGDRLPSVEQMAHEMQVSKPTVGEAIRVLSEFGVVKSRRGVHGGVTVVSDNIPTTLLLLDEGSGEVAAARAAGGPPARRDGDRTARGRAWHPRGPGCDAGLDRPPRQPAGR